VTKPVRVCYVIGSLAVGGAETQLVRLVNGLDRNRFRPSIICMTQGGELEHVLSPDVKVIKAMQPRQPERRGRSRAVLGALLMGSLVREIRQLRPTVVHAYLPAAYVPAGLAAWALRVPLIIAGRRGLTSIKVYGPVRWRLLAELANRAIDVHVCNSNAVRDFAVTHEHLAMKRTRVVYNGIDLPPLERSALPREWMSEGGQAVMVANFIAYKGHRQVLEALARVVQQHPSFRLVLIGDGPQREDLLRQVNSLGIADNVVFAGKLVDAAQRICGFDFSVLGSSEEGFPNALMESMACAVPVISTNVGGVPELVDDGTHGRLVPFGDVDAMAGAMLWMIEHPDERRRMGQNARQRIGDEFSTRRMVAQTEAVYDSFLEAYAQESDARD
jgi:glycosyltransferase involved in cell wall biosynthesis